MILRLVNVQNLFSEDFAETARSWVRRLAAKRFGISTSYTQPRNRSLVLNIAIAPLQDAQGHVAVVADVATRISLEEQLQQREKLSSIGLLAAGVA